MPPPRNFRPKQAQLRDTGGESSLIIRDPGVFSWGKTWHPRAGNPLGPTWIPNSLSFQVVGEIQWSCQKNPRWELHLGRKASQKNLGPLNGVNQQEIHEIINRRFGGDQTMQHTNLTFWVDLFGFERCKLLKPKPFSVLWDRQILPLGKFD